MSDNMKRFLVFFALFLVIKTIDMEVTMWGIGMGHGWLEANPYIQTMEGSPGFGRWYVAGFLFGLGGIAVLPAAAGALALSRVDTWGLALLGMFLRWWSIIMMALYALAPMTCPLTLYFHPFLGVTP